MSDLASHYTYRVVWSAEDEAWIGLVEEWPSLSWIDEESPAGAFGGIVRITRDAVADGRARGEPVPEPLADRRYSGRISLRPPSSQHQHQAIEVAEQRVSRNRLIGYPGVEA
jgi:hypothetical protein